MTLQATLCARYPESDPEALMLEYERGRADGVSHRRDGMTMRSGMADAWSAFADGYRDGYASNPTPHDDDLFLAARAALREAPPASAAEADIDQAVLRACRPVAEAAGMLIDTAAEGGDYSPRFRDLMQRVKNVGPDRFVLVEWIYDIAAALGEGWRVDFETWMSDQARLLVGPDGQRIQVKYHEYMRYAGRIVAFEADEGRYPTIEDVQTRGGRWATVRRDRGVTIIANALRRQVVRPEPTPLPQAA